MCAMAVWVTLPKTNSSPLQMDGWNTILSYWVSAYFQGRLLLVSGRVCLFWPFWWWCPWADVADENRKFPRKSKGPGSVFFFKIGWVVNEFHHVFTCKRNHCFLNSG